VCRYKDNVISEADMCDAAKRLVDKGLPARVDTSLESQFSAEALEANKIKFEKMANPVKSEEKDSSEEEDSDEDLSVAQLRAKMKKRKSAAAAEVRCTVSVGGVKRAMLHSVFHSNRPSSSK
jgi:hypothetical protein